MIRAARAATAAALMAALVCLPVFLDRCAEACEAHSAAAAATPACHHAQAGGARISHSPEACNHDHTASIGAAQAVSWIAQRAFDAVAPVTAGQLAADVLSARVRSTHAPPGPAGPYRSRALPLRV